MNIASTQQPLFTPVRMGKLEFPNRIVMAPLTRMRAANTGHAPTGLHAEYYAQRASAGLIIGECTERVFEKSHAGAIRLSIRRIAARSIIVSEVCIQYS